MALNHIIDKDNPRESEKYSSAFTLSDMEIFIFPELFYPLVLSNILSPAIWEWRNDQWFSGIEKKGFQYKVNRIKQFIIQNYTFNLDLSTWGLTTKEKEISRFADYFDPEILRSSNALFGYEGDKYYFSMDIRKHFGLDKFQDNIIPYWKTETVEAMNAFRHKDGYSGGAGECVSLSALYAAAMFIVGRIPLESIFLVATPLHSQNFITEKDGVLTNNRRIVTKNMWFNGTSLSAKARRALENEKVTIVSHISGHIHSLFDNATIDAGAYNFFCERINRFLVTNVESVIFINFLRFKPQYRSLFQYRHEVTGKTKYLPFEKMIEYEHFSKFNVTTESRSSLLKEVDADEFSIEMIEGRLVLNDFEEFLANSSPVTPSETLDSFFAKCNTLPVNMVEEMVKDLERFCITIPALPSDEKSFEKTFALSIDVKMNREEIANEIISKAETSEMALLTLYVSRQLDKIDFYPFIKAALERSPVCVDFFNGKDANTIYEYLKDMPDESIYSGCSMSQPDEVVNFKRGDGAEKALVMATVLFNRLAETLSVESNGTGMVLLSHGGNNYTFTSSKGVKFSINAADGSFTVI